MPITPDEIVNADVMRADVLKLRKAREQHEKLAREQERELLEEWAADFMWNYDNMIVRYLCIMMKDHFAQGRDGPYCIPDEFLIDAIDLHFANREADEKRAFSVQLYRDLMSYNEIAKQAGSTSCSRLGVRAIDALRELFAKRFRELGYHFKCDPNVRNGRYLIPETFVCPLVIPSSPHFGKIYLHKPTFFNVLVEKIKKALNRKTNRPFLGL